MPPRKPQRPPPYATDLEILERPPSAARPFGEVAQHGVDDPAMKTDRQHDAVGDLPRQLDRLRP